MRKIIIAGNWKMHKTQAEAQAFLQEFKPLIEEADEARGVVLCA
ncbi:MAG: triose-phosphate isomerase, partial [Synechocystis sp.]